MSNTDYDAWLVDLDGTLYHALGVKLAMASELAAASLLDGFRTARLLRRFRHEHEALRQNPELLADLQTTPYHRQLERASEACEVTTAELQDRVERWMLDRPGKWIRAFRRRRLLAEIRTFRAAGGQTALVTDYPASAKLNALGAASLFDEILANGEDDRIRTLKPSPETFLLAAKLLGVDPQRCLVLGDRDDADGEAARRAGMAFRKIP